MTALLFLAAVALILVEMMAPSSRWDWAVGAAIAGLGVAAAIL